MTKLLRRIDDAWYRAERALCVGLLVVMAVAVFLDAVHRQAANEGRLEVLCRKLFGAGAAGPVSTVLAFVIAWWIIYGALRTAKTAKQISAARAAVIGVLGTAAGYGFIRGMVAVFPNGLIWAQSLGLSGMLWVGFIGASMATKEGNHLTLEIMEFVWKGKAKAHVGRAGALAAAVFCVVIGWLCLAQVRIEYGEWAEADGAVGTMSGFPVPRWAIFSILPVAFAVMTLRFLGRVLGETEKEKDTGIVPVKLDDAPPPEAAP
jgi:TRAP-type C4-dicarboxylate transport system permease small subunit